MSRRLDISSLLCDEPPTPAKFGLDALVQAAEVVEQKRLNAPLSLPMILNPMPAEQTPPRWSPSPPPPPLPLPPPQVKSEPSPDRIDSPHLPNDVDMDVAELLVETLKSPGDEITIQPEVEDELLSLVDDVKPRLASPSLAPSPSPLDRTSMPPPPPIVVEPAKKNAKKPGPKPKAAKSNASKPRAKPAPKAKPATTTTTTATTTTTPKPAGRPSAISKRVAQSASSRSRSTSLMPRGSADPDSAKVEDEEPALTTEDDKLYCLCQTKYDDDKFMIACDRCDEWYHTPCVGMPDLEVDLVDQFICPLCIEKHAALHLKTTYKQRCLNGLESPNPASPDACHRPARGAFSKYCSDRCGIENVRRRITDFVQLGGQREALWDAVKDTSKSEGTVSRVDENNDVVPVKGLKSRVDREVERLHTLLDHVIRVREELKQALEIISWRQKLLAFAVGRADGIRLCGWDQRLCFGDEEWSEFGEQVLESYEDHENGMEVDGETDGDWWCQSQPPCGRHEGWQTIRQKDIDLERDRKEAALEKHTTKEREIRKRIEDLLATKPVSKLKLPNGKGRQHNSETGKSARKRKATS